ncbi:DUF1769-domain-containing protein, partial [Decorospora gaudefroyi]
LPTPSPTTSPYFSTPQHKYDRYSISFAFTPKHDVRGDKLVFGNDFDHPIRDRLPPLFDRVFAAVRWWVDPGLEGDVKGEEPYLYGAVLSSINVLRIGEKAQEDGEGEPQLAEEGEGEPTIYTEGADGTGQQIRAEQNIPPTPSARQKHFLTEANRRSFTFEAQRTYFCDFFNPYLDFNEFALKLGYGVPDISILGHWDGQPLRTHSLRYVLKNRETDQELFVVVIDLIPKTGEEAGVVEKDEEDAGDKVEEDENDDLD